MASDLRGSIWKLGLAAASLKLLLVPAAYSTDLEVHRWWKALTFSHPVRDWYTNTDSIWTLDYPPLFAYFERFLAELGSLLHPPLVDPTLHNYDAPAGVLFMRFSVVGTDILLIYAVYRILSVSESIRYTAYTRKISVPTTENLINRTHLFPSKGITAASLVLFNPGLLLVDNMHFQYNGLVLSLLLFSLAFFMERRLSAGAFVFAAAVNLKHTLASAGPCLAVFLVVSVYKSSSTEPLLRTVARLASIAFSVSCALVVSWVPLYAAGGMDSVLTCLRRMFPFGRGLLHAAWAPNIWALYAFLDKCLGLVGCRLREPDVNIYSGHIGAYRPFACLPNPSPRATTLMFILVVFPGLVATSLLVMRLKQTPSVALYLPRLVSYSILSAFMFGWHVHEKMILLATVPLGSSILFDGRGCTDTARVAYVLLCVGGNLALHSLIASPAEAALKILLFCIYTIHAIPWFTLSHATKDRRQIDQNMWWLVVVYFVGAILVELYAGVGRGHLLLFGPNRLEFLPLVLVSVYGGIGVTSGHILLLYDILRLALSSNRGIDSAE